MKILISYRGIPTSPGWSTGDLIVDAFKRLGHEVYTYGNYYKEYYHLLPDHIDQGRLFDEEFDLVLFMECNDPDPQYPNLRYVRAKHFVYWVFDISYYPVHIYNFIQYMGFQHIFCANYLYAKELKQHIPTTFLPYAFSIDKHIPREWPEKIYDFSFIGSPWGERERLYHLLKENDINAVFITAKFREDYIKALAQSHATINYNVERGRGLLVMRFFEAMGAKTCLINNDGDNAEMVASDGQHYLVYHNDQELIDLCKRYKDNLAELDRIGQEGYLYGLTHHTYDSRAKEILHSLGLE